MTDVSDKFTRSGRIIDLMMALYNFVRTHGKKDMRLQSFMWVLNFEFFSHDFSFPSSVKALGKDL